MKKHLLLLCILPIICSCGNEPIEPELDPPFEFKPQGTVFYSIRAACNGYPIEFIDGGGNIDNKIILTYKWSTSFIGNQGDSVRMTLSCDIDAHDPEFDGFQMYSSVVYQGQPILGDTVVLKEESVYPHNYQVSVLGVLP